MGTPRWCSIRRWPAFACACCLQVPTHARALRGSAWNPYALHRRMRDDLQGIRDKTTELEIKVDRVGVFTQLMHASMHAHTLYPLPG